MSLAVPNSGRTQPAGAGGSRPPAARRRAAGLSSRFLRAAVVCAAALLAASCTQRSGLVEQRIFAMGTWVDVVFEAPDRETAEAALADVEATLRRFETDYYAWADGELAALNAALRSGRGIEVSADLARLLVEARELAAASGGAFDPGVGGLVELWGFHRAEAGRSTPPEPAAIEARLRRDSGIGALVVDGRHVKPESGSATLDLGGIAKGEAVDRVIERLRRHGVSNALVNAGGDLRVIGARDGRAWRVAVQDPGGGVLGVIELADGEAAFTSGDYERYFDTEQGRRMHHIIDPRTGYPASGTRAVTVVADDAVHADAAATALFVAGARWRETARAMAVNAVLRVDADGSVAVSQAMRNRISMRDGVHFDVAADS